jgi:uncharacterized membrane protein YccC
LLGALPWFGAAEATTIATTGLVVLTTGFSDDSLLVGRLIDTGIGVVIGLAVNFAVWPPLRRRTAIIAMNRIDDGIGGLLADIGAGLGRPVEETEIEEWIERTRTLDGELDHAWSLVRQARESALMNPRRSAHEVRDPQQWYGLLLRMEQAVAETRSMVRTLGGRVAAGEAWDSGFTAPWTELLTDAGRAVADAEPEAIHEVRQRLERLVSDLSAPGKVTVHWPVYGALVINLRNILDAMDEVAAANPMSLPPLPRPRARRASRSGV